MSMFLNRTTLQLKKYESRKCKLEIGSAKIYLSETLSSKALSISTSIFKFHIFKEDSTCFFKLLDSQK